MSEERTPDDGCPEGGSSPNDQPWEAVRTALGLPEGVQSSLLRQAFTHSSYAREAAPGSAASNQRLEFLGDAVLDLILAGHLYLSHPALSEGRLTKMKATAVRAETLARIAADMDLGRFLALGRGEADSGGRYKPSLLADCLEALVAAVYLSTDLATTEEFVLDRFAGVLSTIEVEQSQFDHKTALQELLQDRTRQAPTYRTVSASGPPHERVFVVEVVHAGLVIGQGQGASKQVAQQAAAGEALATRDQWLGHLASPSSGPPTPPAGNGDRSGDLSS